MVDPALSLPGAAPAAPQQAGSFSPQEDGSPVTAVTTDRIFARLWPRGRIGRRVGGRGP